MRQSKRFPRSIRPNNASPKRRGMALMTLLALGSSASCAVYDPTLLPHDRSKSSGGSTGGMIALTSVSGSAGSAELGGTGGVTGSAGDDERDAGGSGASGAIGASGSSSGGAATSGNGGTVGVGSASSAGAAAVASSGAGSGGNSASAGGTGGTGGAPTLSLALGKSAISSAEQGENPATNGNDGDPTTRWCAPTGQFPQWWRVDLGAAHLLKQIAIRFEYADRTYVYTVETSADDAVYTQQTAVNGIGAVQTFDLPANVSARFVRITITNGIPATANGTATWASMYEVSVTGS